MLDNFMNIYLTMVYTLRQKEKISNHTLWHIKRDILKFCACWESIVNNNRESYTFTFENRRSIVENHYGRIGVMAYGILYRGFYLKQIIKKCVFNIRGTEK